MSACIIWTGHIADDGYGRVRHDGRMTQAHRVAFFNAHRRWPDICRHTCDVRACVNPEHLLDGTYADNARDAVERGRTLRAERNPRAKLTWSTVRYIRSSTTRGNTLARELGVSPSLVSLVRRGKIWPESSGQQQLLIQSEKG